MTDVASILEILGQDEVTANGYRNEIRIEYEFVNLLLIYENSSDDDADDLAGNYDIDEIDTSKLIVTDICLSDGCDARDEEYQENRISYSATMLALIRQINSQIPNAVENGVVDEVFLDDCDLWGCPENVEYGYRILLRREFWEDLDNLRFLMTSLRDPQIAFRPHYEPYIGKTIPDNYHFAFLGTNTKVRRIGYLGLLLRLFEDRTRIAKQNLPKMLERKAEEIRDFLALYKNQKGAIMPSKTGVSAMPYIKLAKELGVIREMTGFYELGKMGRVYNQIYKNTERESDSPFDLEGFEKVFWLERLLEQDFVYLKTLLEYSFSSPNPSYADMRKKFDSLIIERLKAIHRDTKDSLAKTTLMNAIKRIEGWKKSEVYLEHILMPRLNWLYDLGLLDLHKDLTFTLTKEGALLLLNLAEWEDFGPHPVCEPNSYLDLFYMHVANEVFMLGQGMLYGDYNESLSEMLSYCIEHFKTMAPNRVTYSVFQAYAKYMLLQEKAMVVESNDIKNNYLPSVADKYVFMYQRYYNDGFIQKK